MNQLLFGTSTSASRIFSKHYRNIKLFGLQRIGNAKISRYFTVGSGQSFEADFKPEWFNNSDDRAFFIETMKNYKIQYQRDNDLLHTLCDPDKIEALGNNITAITVKTNLPAPFKYRIAPFTLYERYWYEDLLISINERRRQSVALIGSAGTSKSTWQFWYLYRVLQSIHHEKRWPPVSTEGFENTEPPELIIRELATVPSFTFYLMKEKKIYLCERIPSSFFLNKFSPTKVLWLYEPGSSLTPISTDINIPCIATLSPNPIRYHEFCKSVANIRYQMLYTLNELLTIGAHMKCSITNPKLHDIFSPEQISERFNKFGGIIRRVLPDSEETKVHDKDLDNAVNGVLNAVERTIRADHLNQIGSYLVQWSPVVAFDVNDSGKYTITDFTDFQKQITSDFVIEKIKEQLAILGFEELESKLNWLLHTNTQNPMIPSMFEDYVIKYCIKHFDKIKKLLAIKEPMKLTLARELSKYQNMEDGFMYYPLNTTFPAFESYFKSDGRLFVIQASTIGDTKTCVNTAFAKFLSKIDFPTEDLSKITVLYFRSNHQSKWKIKFRDFNQRDITNNQTAADNKLLKTYSLAPDKQGLGNVGIVENNVVYFDYNISKKTFELVGQHLEVTDCADKEAKMKPKMAKKIGTVGKKKLK